MVGGMTSCEGAQSWVWTAVEWAESRACSASGKVGLRQPGGSGEEAELNCKSGTVFPVRDRVEGGRKCRAKGLLKARGGADKGLSDRTLLQHRACLEAVSTDVTRRRGQDGAVTSEWAWHGIRDSLGEGHRGWRVEGGVQLCLGFTEGVACSVLGGG